MGSPVWSLDGVVCTGNILKNKVKLGFMYGASLSDPDKLFNDELAGDQRRANLFHEADGIAEDSLKTLIREAIGFKQARSRR